VDLKHAVSTDTTTGEAVSIMRYRLRLVAELVL
jgi:hypothetical protein